jgi:hypothetical protein
VEAPQGRLDLEQLLSIFSHLLPEEQIYTAYVVANANAEATLASLLSEASGDGGGPVSPTVSAFSESLTMEESASSEWSEDPSATPGPGLEQCFEQEPGDPFQTLKDTFPTVSSACLHLLCPSGPAQCCRGTTSLFMTPCVAFWALGRPPAHKCL